MSRRKDRKERKREDFFFIIMQEKNRQSAPIQAKRIINYIQVEYSFFGYKIFFFFRYKLKFENSGLPCACCCVTTFLIDKRFNQLVKFF